MPLRRRHWIRKPPARVAAGAGSSRKRALPAVPVRLVRLYSVKFDGGSFSLRIAVCINLTLG
jgi:hypothetical protein